MTAPSENSTVVEVGEYCFQGMYICPFFSAEFFGNLNAGKMTVRCGGSGSGRLMWSTTDFVSIRAPASCPLRQGPVTVQRRLVGKGDDTS